MLFLPPKLAEPNSLAIKRLTSVKKGFLFFILFLFPSSWAWSQTPQPPTQVTASFQPAGNQSEIRWTPQGSYRVSGDIAINASRDFTSGEVMDAWQSRGTGWSESNGVVSIRTLLGIGGTQIQGIRVWGGGVGMTDYRFTSRVRVGNLLGDNWGGIVFRFRNANNFYFAALYGNRLALSVVNNGVTTELRSFAVNRQGGTWYTIEVRLRGNNIQLYLDGQLRVEENNNVHATGTCGIAGSVTSFLTLVRSVDFTGPTRDFELRDAGAMVSYTPQNVLARWTGWGAGNWTATTYELRQSLNTTFDTGFFNPAHTTLKNYTYVQEMWIASATDDDVMGLVLRYKQNQANPHRFTGYVFEWSRGGALQPFRRLSRVLNGGFGDHNAGWQRINHTTLFQDNATWSPNTLYTMRAEVNGTRIRVWINEQLWADVNDTSANAPTEGAFGPLNWSNPDYRVRYMTLYYSAGDLQRVIATPEKTAPVPAAWTRLENTSVNTLLTAPFATWQQGHLIPAGHARLERYEVLFTDPSTFEGMVSTDGINATPTNGAAFPYGRQRAGTLRYHVYRNNTRITATPITASPYQDRYDCTVPPGTTFGYQVSQLNPANLESALSTPPASITTANAAPTIAGVPNQSGAHGTPWTLDLTPHVQDINLNPLKITTSSNFVTVTTGLTIQFLYPQSSGVTSERVRITVEDCHGASAFQDIDVTLTNRKPVFVSQPPTAATEGLQYSYNATANDPDQGDVVNYKIIQSPPGATINAATGQLTWTPPLGSGGQSFNFVIEACDNRQPPACERQSWSVNVSLTNRPPTITSTRYNNL